MAVKNGKSLGYPFVESIRSALPLCDEFIISDGYSSDGTYEALKRHFGGISKIKIFRDTWNQKSFKGSAIRNALNEARRRCTKDYIIEIDANEIIPEEDIDFIRSIPEMHPDKELFAFPYYQILGSKILFTEEFRFRMGLNKRSIQILWDGYTMGYKLNLITLLEKGSLRRVINRALSVILEDRIAGGYVPEQSVYLPKPIFRYYSIFPENYFKKMESKIIHQGQRDYGKLVQSKENKQIEDIWNQFEETSDYELFWNRIYEFNIQLIRSGGDLNKEFREKRIIEPSEQPAIIRKLFGMRKYEP